MLPTPKRLLHMQSCSLLPTLSAAPPLHQGLRDPRHDGLSITPRASPACSLPYPSTTNPTPLLANAPPSHKADLFTPLSQLPLPHCLRCSQNLHSPHVPPPTFQHTSQTIRKSSRAEAEHTHFISAQSPMPISQGNKEFTNCYNKHYY